MSTSFNFFERGALPRPEVSPAEAEELVRTRFGVEGRAVELGSQQDANFRIDTDAEAFVLKVSNPAFGAGDLDAQDRAAAHVGALEPEVLVPEAVPGVDGRTLQPIEVGGEPTTARLVRYVEGRMLSESAYLAPPIVAALGDLAGRTTRALASFEAELPQRELQWDLRHAEEVVTRLASYVSVPGGSEAVQRAAAEAGSALVALTQVLPTQPIHGDLTDDNVVAVTDDDGRLRPVGVIDFGDLVQSWAVGELAVTLSSLLAHAGTDLARLLPAVRAFDAVRPLSDAELAALWPLTVLRAAALMVSGQHQASIDRGNEYAAKNLDREWQIFEVATSVPLAVGPVQLRARGETVDADHRNPAAGGPRAGGRPLHHLARARRRCLPRRRGRAPRPAARRRGRRAHPLPRAAADPDRDQLTHRAGHRAARGRRTLGLSGRGSRTVGRPTLPA